MRNKYVWIVIVLAVLIALGVAYKKFGVSESGKPQDTGSVKEVTIHAVKNEWRFDPDEFDAVQGDRLKLTIVNEDDFDHGFSVDAFGISQRIPANATIKIDFVVTQPGYFPFYCSVPCGSGMVNGKERGHFDQVGKIHVKALIK